MGSTYDLKIEKNAKFPEFNLSFREIYASSVFFYCIAQHYIQNTYNGFLDFIWKKPYK